MSGLLAPAPGPLGMVRSPTDLSLGIAMYPRHGRSLDDLMNHADAVQLHDLLDGGSLMPKRVARF